MKILNYGAGAVGLGINSFLLKSGQEVDVIARDNTASALRENGLVRDGIFGDVSYRTDQLGIFTSLDELKSSYDIILVTTKSFDSGFAAKDLSGHPATFNEKTKIVLCQNGWGNAEKFLEFFLKDQVYTARIITGFTRPKPNHITITVHADAVHLGSLFGCDLKVLEPLCKAVDDGGFPCEITVSIEKDIWSKILYNCALNPLGAILDVSYGDLGKQQGSKEIMEDIVHEVYFVMKKAGFKTHWETPEEYLETFYPKMLAPTSKHKSSTLQSLKAQKKTEIDALNGAIVELAKKHNIKVPVNETIYKIIKFIENKN